MNNIYKLGCEPKQIILADYNNLEQKNLPKNVSEHIKFIDTEKKIKVNSCICISDSAYIMYFCYFNEDSIMKYNVAISKLNNSVISKNDPNYKQITEYFQNILTLYLNNNNMTLKTDDFIINKWNVFVEVTRKICAVNISDQEAEFTDNNGDNNNNNNQNLPQFCRDLFENVKKIEGENIQFKTIKVKMMILKYNTIHENTIHINIEFTVYYNKNGEIISKLYKN